jgi:hypothetical protein
VVAGDRSVGSANIGKCQRDPVQLQLDGDLPEVWSVLDLIGVGYVKRQAWKI